MKFGCEALDPVKSTSADWSHFRKGKSSILVSLVFELVMGSLCEEVVDSTAKVTGESDLELSHDALCLVNRMSCCEEELNGAHSESLSESSLSFSPQFSVSLS